MIKIVRSFFVRIFPKIFNAYQSVTNLLFNQGHWRSIKSRSAVDAAGRPIPWYTYPAIEYLRNFDFSKCDVFEFGSGNSSLYWASRAKNVMSVEDNHGWYEIVNKNHRSNLTVIYREEKLQYISALSEQKKSFDIIVIDGSHRFECAVHALKFLKKDGIILLDNSDRIEEHRSGKLLRECGFIQIDFSGFGPINGYCWTTSVFVKGSELYLHSYSNPNPIGGLGN
jgi:hypothetical protein